MAASVTPPPLQGPSAKEKKYDRQLRLWAANGQQALEAAHVLLLNHASGVVGVETLKNLVLPGIGSFTIVDEKTVTEEDLGVNFFLEEDSLGRSRAVETVRLLRELNPEVQGVATSQSTELWLSNSDVSQYTLILIAGPTQLGSVLQTTVEKAQKHGIPVIFIEAIGFYSRFCIQLPPQFPIVETHPDPETTQDLRLMRPWPELLEYMKNATKDLDAMSDDDHGHVPYLLLLLYYLDKWKIQHGQYPTTYKEKTAFREHVRAAARSSSAEGAEENFDEAVSAVLKSLNPPTIPSGLKEVFNEPECQHPTTASANFWVLSHAIDAFGKKNSVLPLPGSIPDMKAKSADYITLQNLYRSKAQSDLAAVTISVRKLEEELNRPPMDSPEIEAFCKGAAFVRLVQGRPIAIPALQPGADAAIKVDWAGLEAMVAQEMSNEESTMPIYMGLAALDCGLDAAVLTPKHTTDPAATLPSFRNGTIPVDVHQAADAMLDSLKQADPGFDRENASGRVRNVLSELARSGPVELHNIASLTGGMVAQEAIKLITKQYVPADNTVVFDGIMSRTGTFRL